MPLVRCCQERVTPMPKFKIKFERTVENYDFLEREVEAESKAAAITIASEMCDEFDEDCPDDVTAHDTFYCQSWRIDEVTEVKG